MKRSLPTGEDALEVAIEDIWQTIAPDVEDTIEDNRNAIEVCLDCGRLEDHGGKVAQAQLEELEEKLGGYSKAIDYLAEKIHLV